MSVLPFVRRQVLATSLASQPAAPAVMPSAAEIEDARHAVRQAVVALGTIDFASLGGRILSALEAERDEDLDTAAEGAWHLRASEAHGLFIAGTFRDSVTVIESVRAKSKGGDDAL